MWITKNIGKENLFRKEIINLKNRIKIKHG